MIGSRKFQALAMGVAVGAALLFAPAIAYAHCDTMDGPVVKAAQAALESNDLAHVMIWVPAKDEAEVRHAFEQTLAVRKLGRDAKELADRHFFETVVRIHRMGEGEPYTGLKPAGSYAGHAVPTVDRALQSGSPAELHAMLRSALDARLDEYFADASKKRAFSPSDVKGGREYVEAYVRLTHFAEELEALTSAHGHGTAAAAPEAAAGAGQHPD
jgi:hypothetical protein